MAEVETQRRDRTPTDRLTTNLRIPSGERNTYDIDLTKLDTLGRNNLVQLVSKLDTQPDQSIDLRNDEPRQGVLVREPKFDRGMLKEVIAGVVAIVAISSSLLFLKAGYPALILPLLGVIATYYYGNKSR